MAVEIPHNYTQTVNTQTKPHDSEIAVARELLTSMEALSYEEQNQVVISMIRLLREERTKELEKYEHLIEQLKTSLEQLP